MSATGLQDDDRGPGLIACMAITTTAALLAVCLRIYVRASLVQRLGMDDWTIVLAMVEAPTLKRKNAQLIALVCLGLCYRHIGNRCRQGCEWLR